MISNICYAPSVVAQRINRLLPENTFELILTSSNYIFRKPHKRLFDLALEKADLPYTEDRSVLTVTDWAQLRQRMEEYSNTFLPSLGGS